MENLLLIIKKAPLVTWKAFLVLWAFFLGFMMLVFKCLKFMSQYFAPNGAIGTIIFRQEVLSEMKKMNTQRSSDDPHW